MKTTIPAGFKLTVCTWENDADNHKTEVLEGLTHDMVLFYVDLCKMHRKDSKHGNLYDPTDSQLEAYYEELFNILKKHENTTRVRYKSIEKMNESEYIYDILFDLGLSGGEFYSRRCDKYKVEFVPHDIVVTDVTESFK